MSPSSPTGHRFKGTVLDREWFMEGLTPRLAEWLTWMQAEGHSVNTTAARTRRVQLLEQHIGHPAEDATTAEVAEYLASIPGRAGTGIDKTTRATYHGHLRAWFLHLIAVGYRDDNPMDKMKPPKPPRREPRPVSDAEFAAIMKVRVHKRTKMMLYLAAFEGLRVHEIAKLRGEDVNLIDGLLLVKGKGEVVATLQLHPDVAELAQDFPRRGWWFPTIKTGNVMSDDGHVLPRSVSNIIVQVFKRAGVSGGAHRLRHWHGTEMLLHGADVRVVQTMLRHANLSTTALYTRVDRGQQRAAIGLLHLPNSQTEAESQPA